MNQTKGYGKGADPMQGVFVGYGVIASEMEKYAKVVKIFKVIVPEFN